MNAGAELLHELSGGKRDRKLSMRAVEAQTNAKEIDDSVFNSRLGKKKKDDTIAAKSPGLTLLRSVKRAKASGKTEL